MDKLEEIIHVYREGKSWCVKSSQAKEARHNRKASAALHAKQLANCATDARVVFHESDGSVEVEKFYHRSHAL